MSNTQPIAFVERLAKIRADVEMSKQWGVDLDKEWMLERLEELQRMSAKYPFLRAAVFDLKKADAAPKTMADWAEEIHVWANSKGWWSRPSDTIAGKLLLVMREASEAAEELRLAGPNATNPADVDFAYLRQNGYRIETDRKTDEQSLKPVGFASEIADTLIRLLDLCHRTGINPDEVVAIKMAYNATRSHRHGGKGL